MSEREPIYFRGNTQTPFFTGSHDTNELLDAIIESSHDGIYITDGQAVTLRVNRAYLSITGLRAGEIMGRNMCDIEREGVINRSGTLIVLAERRPISMEQIFKTGKRALITSTPVFNEAGEIVMVVSNVRDMTELYELQEKCSETEIFKQKYYSEMEFTRHRLLDSSEFFAVDAKMLSVLQQVDKVSSLNTTVLLLGETGVGKEQVAKYIYKNSPRRKERFITINCGAIAPNLIESELFGYKKGAFTGANREGKLGIFEVADKGTIFLDEVGELPLDMQVKLLRVLQERQITPVGGSELIPVDVRVLAATNRDLEQMVKKQTFREDLFYRLSVIPITIPPLRERRDDIIPFAQRFLAELNKKYGFHKEFASSTLTAMRDYTWPGNVRELKNQVERMVIMSNSDVITPELLPFYQTLLPGLLSSDMNTTVNLKALRERFELKFIHLAYEKYGNVRDAAASLGMDAATYVRKRKKYERLYSLHN